jgi:CubicO group peptidase (beta-lactamase class C family)
MLPTSSCGKRFSVGAIGHTGFTGTSLWIDPELDLYVALLSNRVHPTRTNNRWQALRPRLHDASVEAALRSV